MFNTKLYPIRDSSAIKSGPALMACSFSTFTQGTVHERSGGEQESPCEIFNNRVALKDDVVCGYQIPKGATISLSPYVTQHLPEIWENPEAFDPDRFTPERSEGRPPYAYFPFGGGPRLCIGKSFALTEAPLVLSTIVQQCRLFLLPAQTVRARPQGTLRPDGGLPMTVHFRQQSA